MRPFDPVPLTRDRSTPSSRANARTDGDACAFLKPSLSTGGAAAWPAALPGADGAAGWGAAPAWAPGAGAVAVRCDDAAFASGLAASAPAPSASSVKRTLPSLTLSPSLTLRSLTLPADGDGTSMVALSDSSVTSESSALTESPGLTSNSMTGTSLKSPMSGTLTSIVLIASSKGFHHRDTEN